MQYDSQQATILELALTCLLLLHVYTVCAGLFTQRTNHACGLRQDFQTWGLGPLTEGCKNNLHDHDHPGRKKKSAT